MRWGRGRGANEHKGAAAPGHVQGDTVPLDGSALSTAADSLRFEVRPPALFGDDADAGARQGVRSWLPSLSGMRDWLNTGWHSSTLGAPERPGREAAPLHAARLSFLDALSDIDDMAAHDLAARAREAPSLRDLWHLRNELFTQVSIRHCESVAHVRLAALNHWFPVRVRPPASGPRSVSRHSLLESVDR